MFDTFPWPQFAESREGGEGSEGRKGRKPASLPSRSSRETLARIRAVADAARALRRRGHNRQWMRVGRRGECGVGAEQPLHAWDKVGLRRLGDEVKMIAHETPGMKLPAGLGAGFAQGGEEGAAVRIIAKNRLAPVAAIHEVVDGSGKGASRHCPRAGDR